jgi:hypothetical protein
MKGTTIQHCLKKKRKGVSVLGNKTTLKKMMSLMIGKEK